MAKDPEKIKTFSVFKAFNQDLTLSHCVARPETCKKVKTCHTRKFIENLSKIIEDKLKTTTLKDIMKMK